MDPTQILQYIQSLGLDTEGLKQIGNLIGNGNIGSLSGIMGGINDTLQYKAFADLGDTNKRLPNLDPFATPKTVETPIWKQISSAIFATGGDINTQNIEAEGGEIFQTPNGSLSKINGPNHSNGGVNLNLPEGTTIYSKRVKVNGKSMADRKIEREKKVNKANEKYNKDKTDSINRNTYERTKQVADTQEYYDTRFMNILNKVYEQGLQAGQYNQNEEFATGGTIHIKPENRGKFTKYCGGKVTNECIQRGLKSKNPTIRKRANFARNARKWNKKAATGMTVPPTNNPVQPGEFDWTNANQLQHAYDWFADPNYGFDRFNSFVQYYQNTSGQEYPVYQNNKEDAYKSFLEKVQEAGYNNLDKTGNVKVDIYKDTHTKSGDTFVKTMPFLGAYINNLPNFMPDVITKGDYSGALLGGFPGPNPNPNPNNQDQPNPNPEPNPNDGTKPAVSPEDIKQQNEQLTQQVINKKLYQGTYGDYIGQAGTVLGMLGPASLTLMNRLGDRPNISFYKDVGKRSLDSLDNSGALLKRVADNYVQEIDRLSQGQVNRNRMSARTVNVQRALDTVTHAQTLKQINQLQNNINQQLAQINNAKAQTQFQQDTVRAQGENNADIANRMDRDAFYTNLTKDLNTAATMSQALAKSMNQQTYNAMFLQMLPDITKYGLGYMVGPNGALNMFSTYNDNSNGQ